LVHAVEAAEPLLEAATIHVLAAVAEHESRIESERMKGILVATKRRGSEVRKMKGDSTRRFPSGYQQARAERGRSERKREDLTVLDPKTQGF
jgi:DNA invertase Pin-like site-specific DNA recombinase